MPKSLQTPPLKRIIFLVALILIGWLFFSLRVNENERFINRDEAIPIAVSAGMSDRGDLNTNWSIAETLPDHFRYDQYGFSSYHLVAHAALETQKAERPLAVLRHLNLPLQAIGIILILATLRNYGFGITEQLAAAGGLSILPGLVQDAHMARPESFLFLCFALVLFALSFGKRARLSGLLAGAAIGVGVATKITFILAGLLLVPKVFELIQRKFLESVIFGFIALIGLILGFVLTAPYVIQDFDAFLNGVTYLQNQYANGHPPHSAPSYTLIGQIFTVIIFITLICGPLLLSVAVAHYQHHANLLIGLALFGSVNLLYLAPQPVFFERNLMLALAAFVLMVSVSIRSLAGIGLAVMCALPMMWWSAHIASESRGLFDARTDFEIETFGERIPHAWSPAGSVEMVRSCDGKIGFHDYGDAYSSKALEALAQADAKQIAEYKSAFSALPTSTLHTYLDSDMVYFKCGTFSEGSAAELGENLVKTSTAVSLACAAGLAACGADTSAPATDNSIVAEATSAPTPSVPETQIGSELATDREITGGFVENGYYHEQLPRDALISNVSGSYGEAGDSDTGQLVLNIAPRSELVGLVLPVVTGPDSSSSSIEVVCGETIQTLDLSNNITWAMRSIPLNDCTTGTPVTITVIDAGTEWGQWIAVGAPREKLGS
ncbi:MAG: hypothetical protein AAFQ22_10845 [Pseudomonadota bacterium]